MLFDPPEGKRSRTSTTVSPDHTSSFTGLNALAALAKQ
jgi:hypothetical protein